MASKWWIFVGCACICTGFLLPLGIIILVFYFIEAIFRNGGVNTGTQYIDNHYNNHQYIDKFNYFDQNDDDDDDDETQTFNKGNRNIEFMDYKTREENA